MTIRGSTGWMVACAAAFSIGFAASAPAQDTTRTRPTTSQARIPVQKRISGGEVVIARDTAAERMRADSIARADSMALVEKTRRDSVALVEKSRADRIAAVEKVRRDSLEAIERTRRDATAAVERARADSIARTDSIMRQQQIRMETTPSRSFFRGSGWYIGLSGGSSMPTSDLKGIGYGSGFNLDVPIGWHRVGRLLGFRLDLGYNRFSGGTTSVPGTGGSSIVLDNPDPMVMSAELNGTLKLPINESKTSTFYLVGGGGLYRFSSFGSGSALGSFLGNDVFNNSSATDQKVINKWGANAGAGIELGIGSSALFLETRVVNVFTARAENPSFDATFGNRGDNIRWIPIALGFTIR